MKDPRDAVRWLRSGVVKTGNTATAFEKRAFLRHFADIARPVCEIRAQLRSVEVLPCMHERCSWAFVQAAWQTRIELSASGPKIARVCEALRVDGWIVTGQVLADGVVLYLLNRKKLLHGQSPVPNREPAKCLHIPRVERQAEASR